MADQYLQIAVLAVIAVLIPASMLIFSMLVRPRSDNNGVERLAKRFC